jgi:hypothetical protein
MPPKEPRGHLDDVMALWHKCMHGMASTSYPPLKEDYTGRAALAAEMVKVCCCHEPYGYVLRHESEEATKITPLALEHDLARRLAHWSTCWRLFAMLVMPMQALGACCVTGSNSSGNGEVQPCHGRGYIGSCRLSSLKLLSCCCIVEHMRVLFTIMFGSLHRLFTCGSGIAAMGEVLSLAASGAEPCHMPSRCQLLHLHMHMQTSRRSS